MSTTDPDARSRERLRRTPFVGLWTTLTIVSGAVLFGPGLVAAAGRDINDDPTEGAFAVGGFVLGCNLAPWSIMLLMRGLGRAGVLSGRGRRATGLFLAGVGLGSTAGAAAVIRAQLAGSPVRPALLLVTVVSAVAGLLVGGWLAWTAVTRAALAARVRATGVRTTGEITHVALTGTRVNGVPRVRFTVRFADQQGVPRYVRGARVVSSFAAPSVGDTTAVWFDPTQPGNVHAIVVDLFT